MKSDDSIIQQNSKAFALRIIKVYKFLTESAQEKEYIMSKQLLRSGTSIGANVYEAARAQSKADFLSKMNISLKEAHETQYWIELLSESGYLPSDAGKSILDDCIELNKILSAIVKTTKESLG